MSPHDPGSYKPIRFSKISRRNIGRLLPQDIRVKKGLFPWNAFGRATANGRDEGVTKLLFDDSPEAHGHGKWPGSRSILSLPHSFSLHVRGRFVVWRLCGRWQADCWAQVLRATIFNFGSKRFQGLSSRLRKQFPIFFR